jgi:hypothetical protein
MTEEQAEQTQTQDHEWHKTVSERGRRSAEEGTRLLVTIATASLGVFFMALSKKFEPALDRDEKTVAVLAVLAMAVASGCGILSWWADAKVHINWALALPASDSGKRGQYFKARDRWRKIEKDVKWFFFGAFGIGIVAAAVFLILRIVEPNL